jgi:hypothetical protein
MPSPCKELKNIPVSISILHEQEYNNLWGILHIKDGRRRRILSEKSAGTKGSYYRRRGTLKN